MSLPMIVAHGFQKMQSLMEGQQITGTYQLEKFNPSQKQSLRLKVNFHWEIKEIVIQQNFLKSKTYFI